MLKGRGMRQYQYPNVPSHLNAITRVVPLGWPRSPRALPLEVAEVIPTSALPTPFTPLHGRGGAASYRTTWRPCIRPTFGSYGIRTPIIDQPAYHIRTQSRRSRICCTSAQRAEVQGMPIPSLQAHPGYVPVNNKYTGVNPWDYLFTLSAFSGSPAHPSKKNTPLPQRRPLAG